MQKRGPAFGFLLLLAGFAFSLWQVGTRRAEELSPDVRTLRIGHWLIHAGMREAMDAVIADYERLHPDVRIKQNTVPMKTWFAWQRAQWTGGNTPDIMQLGKGTTDDTIARYYTALPPPRGRAQSLQRRQPLGRHALARHLYRGPRQRRGLLPLLQRGLRHPRPGEHPSPLLQPRPAP